MPLSLILQEQMHLVQQALMLGAGFHNIDSCRLDAGMSQHIRQLRDIFSMP